ncbi:MAG: hypothetical protein WDN44_10910 [Sphingomonas sp.]
MCRASALISSGANRSTRSMSAIAKGPAARVRYPLARIAGVPAMQMLSRSPTPARS